MSRKWILVALLAGLAGVMVVSALHEEQNPTRLILDKHWPTNFAHRGASAVAPENTLAAFDSAVAAGAGGLELDVHMTRDGHVVVIHDATVDRTTDGSGAVRDMTLAELRRLDAGYRYYQDGGYPYRDRRLRVPTLEEVLRRFPQVYVNIEIKEEQPGIEQSVLYAIEDARAADRVLVVSRNDGVIERFRETSGGRILTGASKREIRIFYLLSRVHLEGMLDPPYDALQVPVDYQGIRLVTPRFLAAGHSQGVRVDVWTVDNPGEMRRLLDLGVDGVMTDRPKTLANIIDERREDHGPRSQADLAI